MSQIRAILNRCELPRVVLMNCRRTTKRRGDYPSSCRSSTVARATFQSLRRASSSSLSTTCLKLGPVRIQTLSL